MKKVIKVGILDDDSSKIIEIETFLKYGISEFASEEKKLKYDKYDLDPYVIELQTDIEDMIEKIREEKLDCVLIDYKLSSYEVVNFTGVEFAKELEKILYDFPIFILTAYEDDLFNKEIYNAYQVFNYSEYLDNERKNLELNFKIIEQVLKKERELKEWEKEIIELLPQAGSSALIDDRILELDTKLEKSLNAKYAFPVKTKKDLSNNKIEELLKKIDKILEKEEWD